jgi:NADP-dependent aldehyde dehydrogenase
LEFKNSDDNKRAEFLRAIANEMELLGDNLLEIFCLESGLSIERAKIERQRTTFQLRMFADFICENEWRKKIVEHRDLTRSPVPKPELIKTYIPLGPIAVFGSSNFPLAYSTAGGDTASAFAVGCPVIVKSHPMHAGTGELVAGAINRAAISTEMPNGVFSNLNTRGIELGAKLAKQKCIKAIGFTGSIRGGRALMDIASSREEPIPVFAEMGSTNPVIISDQALKEKMDYWVEQYANSITNGTGQFCTNPGLIIGLVGELLDEFTTKLSKALENIEPSCMLGPSIYSSFNRLKEKAISSKGTKLLTQSGTSLTNFGSNTLLRINAIDFMKHDSLRNEIFGPLSVVVGCENKKNILEVIQSLHGQLTGTVITGETDVKEWLDITEVLQLKVGRIIYNGVPTGVEVCQAMQHGGPYPASSDSRFTAVGVDSVKRWVRPVVFQNFPVELLPAHLYK